MKLLVVAALIAVTSAGRLDHLERSYLPPDNNNLQGNYATNGFGSTGGGQNGFGKDFGNGLNSGSNGFGTNGQNGFSSSGTFGSNGASPGTNGFGVNGVTGGRNGAFGGATSNQYLPPNQGLAGSGSNGFSFGGSSIKPACSSCGSSRYSTQQYTQGSQPSVPGASYGVPQFGSTLGSPSGSVFGSPSGSLSGSTFGSSGASGDSTFGSPTGNFGSQSPVNRQYLAPKTLSQGIPQQPFDEKYGYVY